MQISSNISFGMITVTTNTIILWLILSMLVKIIFIEKNNLYVCFAKWRKKILELSSIEIQEKLSA